MVIASGIAITTLIAALAQAVVAIFAYLLAIHNTKNDKKSKKQEKIEKAEDKVDDACNNGGISELIDAAKELGDAKKGK
jgi:hypothetical protein